MARSSEWTPAKRGEARIDNIYTSPGYTTVK
jgi:hypothetical protein